MPISFLLMDLRSSVACLYAASATNRGVSFYLVCNTRPFLRPSPDALDNAKTEKQKHQATLDATRDKLEEIPEKIEHLKNTIRELVDSYDGIALSNGFVGHVRSAIHILKLRREELKGLPHTDTEVALVQESIEKFEQKLRIIAEESSDWYKFKSLNIKAGLARVVAWRSNK
ncbi:hypothetical protein FRC12_015595 [Ceratobasidium sp. 428]|nr:hypothetical protein FRC12_015595 [Ceratobasidium sp. 428]